MDRFKVYHRLLEELLACIEAECARIRSGVPSVWDLKVLYGVVHPEVRELLDHARQGEVFFKYGKGQRQLESTYLMTDSLSALNQTKLGEKISELQKIYNRL